MAGDDREFPDFFADEFWSLRRLGFLLTMTIEDRIRRVLAEAVSDEPPLRGAPLEVATRHRRARPLLAGVVAMVLVLAAAVTLAAVRGQRQQAPLGPTPTTIPSTSGWRTYTDPTGYLRFHYPEPPAVPSRPVAADLAGGVGHGR